MPRHRPSLSLVISLLALVLASAGAGYAAGALPDGSVGTAQLKARSVTVSKLAPAAIKKLSGKRGQRGKAGPAGRSALSPLRSGETITGAWSVTGASTGYDIDAITLPVPAPTPLDDAHVQLDGVDESAQTPCSGTTARPTAPKGVVCIYLASQTSFTAAASGGFGARHDYNGGAQTAADTASRSGFGVYIVGSSSGFFATGIWAYTAP